MKHFARQAFRQTLLLAALLSLWGMLWAQTSEPELKAAYTLNFAKFTRWPSDARREPSTLKVCVVGRSSVGESLEDKEGERIIGKTLEVDYVRLPGRLDDCAILYISEFDTARLPRTLAAVAQLPVLTVSDMADFVGNGGMIGLVRDGTRLRFKVNLDAVNKAGLRLEPKLLKLAIGQRKNTSEGDAP